MTKEIANLNQVWRIQLKLKRIFAHDLFWCIALLVGSLLVYARTLSHSLPPLDSAEFITAALSRGVAHPPGYPVLTVTGIVFSYLPFGNPLMQVNSVSAVFAALALAFLFQTLRNLGCGLTASVVSTLTLGFNVIFWEYAGISEVFALHSFFVVVLIWSAVKFASTRRQRYFWVIAFVFGLGAGHLHTLALLTLPILYLIFPSMPRTVRQYLPVFFFFFLPLSFYLYLPWAASFQPLLNQGDPVTWDRFWDVFLRRSYGTFNLSQYASGDRFENMAHQMGRFSEIWFRDSFGLGAVLACIGIWNLRCDRRLSISFLLYLFLSLPFFLFLANAPASPIFDHVIEKQYGGALVVLSFYIAFGVDFIDKLASQNQKTFLFRTAFQLGLLALLISLYWANFSRSDHSNENQSYRYAELIIDSVEENALVFSCYDTIVFSLKYMQAVEGRHPKAAFVSFNPAPTEISQILSRLPGTLLQPQNGMTFSQALIDREKNRRPIYFTFAGKCGGQDLLGPLAFQLAPQGVVYQLVPERTRAQLIPRAIKGLQILAAHEPIRLTASSLQDAGFLELVSWYENAHTNLAFIFRSFGMETEARHVEGLLHRQSN